MSNVYTAWVQQANGRGTMWVSAVTAPNIEDAKTAAENECADDWGYPVEDVLCIGLAEGTVNLVHWVDGEA